jgi:ubiquinone/menaquinone biosynthesis C-methylase UbiE
MIHSEEYIKDSRFTWWNPDYLDLLIERFALRDAKIILDVGVGLGHWSRLLLKRLPAEWTFHGLDMEKHWVDKGLATFAAEFPDVDRSRFEFRQGDAHSLPYSDEVTAVLFVNGVNLMIGCLSWTELSNPPYC